MYSCKLRYAILGIINLIFKLGALLFIIINRFETLMKNDTAARVQAEDNPTDVATSNSLSVPAALEVSAFAFDDSEDDEAPNDVGASEANKKSEALSKDAARKKTRNKPGHCHLCQEQLFVRIKRHMKVKHPEEQTAYTDCNGTNCETCRENNPRK